MKFASGVPLAATFEGEFSDVTRSTPALWRAFFKAAVAVSLLMFIRPDNIFREATVCALVATGGKADIWTRLAA